MKAKQSINNCEKIETSKRKQTNSLDVRSACMTCCSLSGREKDAETSKDLVLGEEGLQEQRNRYR